MVEAFIDELDLAVLGFAGVIPEAMSRPSYHPSTLLKIYLYGYLNRRLKHESQRNIELMWLTGRLTPDFKTIADFRRDKARSMAISGRGTGIVGYNVQIAVGAEHRLIVAHEVINQGCDRASERHGRGRIQPTTMNFSRLSIWF